MRVPTSIESKVQAVKSLVSAHLFRTLCQAAIILIVTVLFANMSPFMAQSEPQPVPLPTASSGLTASGSGLTTSGGSTKIDNTQTGVQLPGAVSAGCVTYGSPTQLAFFYNPPDNVSSNVLANNFNSFVYTRNFESAVDDLSDKGEYPVMQYL
ncbi:MAG: hypothetical protein H7X77_07050, partial [Anaerolineae bacterium]|nr:hypothetical protein [Anaerolineae bacterium]